MSNLFNLPYITKNGKLLKTTIDAGKFLSESQRGAYTGARTIKTENGKFYVFNLRQHVKRLSDSCQIMIKENYKNIPKCFEKITNEALLQEELKKNLKEGFLVDNTKDDLKLTILITWENDSCDLLIHFSRLNDAFDDKIKRSIEFIPGSRKHILAKDSEWVRYRKQIEDVKFCKTSNEVVLVDHEGHANEGLSSNFFVLMNDNRLYTSNEGIISGTVRTLILQICKDENIEVVFKAPKISEISEWKEVFISSTTRLVFPVEKVYLHKTEKYFDGIFGKENKNDKKQFTDEQK
eukprot:gene3744-6632_t